MFQTENTLRKDEVLPHLSCQISLCPFVYRIGKHGLGVSILHQFALIHEHGLGRNTHGLSHVMSNNQNGYFLLKFKQ